MNLLLGNIMVSSGGYEPVLLIIAHNEQHQESVVQQVGFSQGFNNLPNQDYMGFDLKTHSLKFIIIAQIYCEKG